MNEDLLLSLLLQFVRDKNIVETSNIRNEYVVLLRQVSQII